MAQITARVSDEVAEALDAAAATLKRSRAEVIRQALEIYLEDFDDLTVALERLRTPPIRSWIGTRSGVSYSIRIKCSARRELAQLQRDIRDRIIDAIDALREQPLSGSPLKGGLRGLRRQRVGDYRILYELLDDELVILVVRVAHRRESYLRR